MAPKSKIHICNQEWKISSLETDLKLTKEFLMDITKRIEKKIDEKNDEIKTEIVNMAKTIKETYATKTELALFKQEVKGNTSVKIAFIQTRWPIITAWVAFAIALMK